MKSKKSSSLVLSSPPVLGLSRDLEVEARKLYCLDGDSSSSVADKLNIKSVKGAKKLLSKDIEYLAEVRGWRKVTDDLSADQVFIESVAIKSEKIAEVALSQAMDACDGTPDLRKLNNAISAAKSAVSLVREARDMNIRSKVPNSIGNVAGDFNLFFAMPIGDASVEEMRAEIMSSSVKKDVDLNDVEVIEI